MMQVVIQHPVTKRFYKGLGEWTDLRSKAMVYNACSEAASECYRENIQADLLLTIEGSATDLKVAWLMKRSEADPS